MSTRNEIIIKLDIGKNARKLLGAMYAARCRMEEAGAERACWLFQAWADFFDRMLERDARTCTRGSEDRPQQGAGSTEASPAAAA